MTIDSEIPLTVESNDDNGHLNNSVYSAYFEKGRKDIAKKTGMDGNTLRSQNKGFFVTDSHITYKTPVYAGEEVVVRSRINYAGGVKVVISQEMLRNGAVVASAETNYCCLKNGKAVKPFRELIEGLEQKK